MQWKVHWHKKITSGIHLPCYAPQFYSMIRWSCSLSVTSCFSVFHIQWEQRNSLLKHYSRQIVSSLISFNLIAQEATMFSLFLFLQGTLEVSRKTSLWKPSPWLLDLLWMEETINHMTHDLWLEAYRCRQSCFCCQIGYLMLQSLSSCYSVSSWCSIFPLLSIHDSCPEVMQCKYDVVLLMYTLYTKGFRVYVRRQFK